MKDLENYRESFENHLINYVSTYKTPENLYAPIRYIVGLGGKRLRPMLTLLACDIFDKPFQNGLDAALAIELFHNFSLMHDDIMDRAPLRRGHVTVHEKWDTNTAILSGDALLILAYRLFENYSPLVFHQLATLFSKTAIEVCEGQQLDIDFQYTNQVSVGDYIDMICRKTAVLLGAALEMGAIIAECSPEDQQHLYEYGKNLGIAFQLQDDYLDVFGNSETFGKQLGGDIIENKKTFLYLKSLEKAPASQRTLLEELFSIRPENPSEKIETVTKIFLETGVTEETQITIQQYVEAALVHAQALQISHDNKQLLTEFAHYLTGRSF